MLLKQSQPYIIYIGIMSAGGKKCLLTLNDGFQWSDFLAMKSLPLAEYEVSTIRAVGRCLPPNIWSGVFSLPAIRLSTFAVTRGRTSGLSIGSFLKRLSEPAPLAGLPAITPTTIGPIAGSQICDGLLTWQTRTISVFRAFIRKAKDIIAPGSPRQMFAKFVASVLLESYSEMWRSSSGSGKGMFHGFVPARPGGA